MLGRVWSVPCHPRAAQGGGSSRHLWPHAGTAGYQDPLEPVLQNSPRLPRNPSWLNILPLLPKLGAYSRLPGRLQLRERSWSFLPSLTQPKAPAPFCLRGDVGSGTQWDEAGSLSLWASGHPTHPVPSPKFIPAFHPSTVKACSDSCSASRSAKQVVYWKGLVWGRGWGFGVFSF